MPWAECPAAPCAVAYDASGVDDMPFKRYGSGNHDTYARSTTCTCIGELILCWNASRASAPEPAEVGRGGVRARNLYLAVEGIFRLSSKSVLEPLAGQTAKPAVRLRCLVVIGAALAAADVPTQEIVQRPGIRKVSLPLVVSRGFKF